MYSKEEFVFTLSKPLNYQDTQSDQETLELVLYAPTSKHEKYVCNLQQQLMKSTLKVTKIFVNKDKPFDNQHKISDNQEQLENDEKGKRDFVLVALKAGSDNFYEFKQTFYKMICDGLCYIDGSNDKTKITHTLLRDLSLPDKDNLVGEYVANFISP